MAAIQMAPKMTMSPCTGWSLFGISSGEKKRRLLVKTSVDERVEGADGDMQSWRDLLCTLRQDLSSMGCAGDNVLTMFTLE